MWGVPVTGNFSYPALRFEAHQSSSPPAVPRRSLIKIKPRFALGIEITIQAAALGPACARHAN